MSTHDHAAATARAQRRRRLGWTDLLVATAAGLTCLVEATFVTTYGPYPVYVANLALHVVIGVGIVVRRVWVVPSFLVVFGGLACLAALLATSPVNLGTSLILFAAPLSLYTITRWGPTARWGTAALLLGIVGAFGSPAARMRDPSHPTPVLTMGLVLVHVLLLVGVYVIAADRRRAVEERQAAAARQAAADAESAAVGARLAAGAERLLIAREVHDIVGHALSVVQVQAATALMLDEAARRDALVAIRDVSRGALGDTRSLVHALRDDAGTGPTGELAVLPGMIGAARSAGLDLAATLPPDLEMWQDRMPALTRLALVRAVQECLTNALRHASPRRAELVLTVDAGKAQLRVSNPSAMARPAGGVGYGLVGLRERVEAAGGVLDVRREDELGAPAFVVEASLPTTPREEAR